MEKKGIFQQGLDLFRELTQPYDDDPDQGVRQPAPDTGSAGTAEQSSVQGKSAYSSYGSSYGGTSYGGGVQGNFATAYATDSQAAPKTEKVVSISAAALQPNVVVVKPEQYEELRDVADHLLAKRIVFLNLERTEKDISQRLLDFLNGVVYALDGDIKKAAAASYIIVPNGVNIVDSFMDDLDNRNYTF